MSCTRRQREEAGRAGGGSKRKGFGVEHRFFFSLVTSVMRLCNEYLLLNIAVLLRNVERVSYN